MKAKYLLCASLFLGAARPAFTQAHNLTQQDSSETLQLTLNDVWEKASIYSKSVQIRKLQRNGAEELIKDARNERLPEITIGGEYAKITNMPVYTNGLFHTPSQFEVIHTTYTLGSEAYLNVYNGGKTNLEIAERKTEDKISGEQLNLTLSEAKLQAAAYYLDMERSIIFQNLMRKDIEAQEKQLQQLRVLKANGVVLKSDVLRAELKLSRQKLALVTLDNDLAIANEKLNFLIGLPKDQRVMPDMTHAVDSLAIKPVSEYLADAGVKAYQVRISKQETDLRALKLKAVKANILPRVGLFGTYQYSYPQIFLYPYSPYIYGIGLAGVKASFSLSSLYHNNHKTKVAALEYESQEVEHAQVQDKTTQQVDEAYLRLQEMLNRIEVSKVNIRQAVENKRIVSNTYFNQTSLITDLLDADTQLLQTKFDLASAQIAARMQYYQLQNITGNL